MNWRSFSKSKWLLAGLILLAVFLGQLHYQQWVKRKSVEEQIQKLVAQEKDLDQKNSELAQSLAYLQSTGYKERAAREQLGLKKEGEIVVKFEEPQTATESAKPTTKTDNFESWIKYFFPNK